MKKQTGFTLMELIIVIIIFGLLSAFTIPKYMGLYKEIRKSTVKALQGNTRAAAEMVHSVALEKHIAASTNANLGNDTFVTISASHYPSANATGISAALKSTSGFTITTADNLIVYNIDGAPGNCSVSYEIDSTETEAQPVITLTETGC
jgi:MSHA pilin protein MshA